jgi:hypothetical protein
LNNRIHGKYLRSTLGQAEPTAQYFLKNSTTGFNSSILRHSEIGGTPDEAVLNIVHLHYINLQAKTAEKKDELSKLVPVEYCST